MAPENTTPQSKEEELGTEHREAHVKSYLVNFSFLWFQMCIVNSVF